jgi:hypothetical protein
MTPHEKGLAAIDERQLADLVEESADLHADSMRSIAEPLDEMVEAGLERRRHEVDPAEMTAFATARDAQLSKAFGGKMLVAAGASAALVGLLATDAFASSPSDVQILQTAASIENLAVATYAVALTLPFIGGTEANPVVKTFVTTTMQQHTQHGQAFNAAIARLGGTKQTNPDPALLAVVNQAKPGLTSAGPVVALALELEQGAAETYVANVSALSDNNAQALTASIMGVEAQHAAILRAVQALVEGNDASAITLPPPVASLPAAAGSVGFPDSFFPTNQARPATEGAVK